MTIRHNRFVNVMTTATLMVSVLFMVSGNCVAQDDILGPRFEAGGGVSGASVNTPAAWASGLYGAGVLTGAFRFFKGLSVQGGFEYGAGTDLGDKLVRYGENTYIDMSDGGTYVDTRWYGLRYELPMEAIGKQPLDISAVYIGAGVINTEFGMDSDAKTVAGLSENSSYSLNYRAAKLNGYYAMIGARWRLETVFSVEPGTWLDSIGIDLGARYNHYGSIDVENAYLDHPSSDVSAIQLFFTGLIKFDLFY